MRNLIRLASGLFAMCGVFTSYVPAQQQTSAAPSSGYSITTNVRRVVVDVVVTNPDGEPVPGLTQKDFSVEEDGKAQSILSFDAHDNDSWKQTLPANLPAHTFINLPRESERGPLYVLLYDLGNSTIEGQHMDGQMFARQQLVRFVEDKPAGTRFAVIDISDAMHLIQGFTSDKQLVSAALDIRGRTPHMPMVSLSGNIKDYLGVLKEVAAYLDGLPGRKNVIWVSGDFPFHIAPPWPPEMVEPTLKELKVMAANEIAIYPVSAGGIEGLNEKTLTLDEVARETGGQAFYNSNDVVGLLNKATRDGAIYYTLSYSSTNRNYDGKLRHIQVKLPNTSYTLSYRRQYYADADGAADGQSVSHASYKEISAKDASGTAPADTLYTFVRHGMPMSHEILFSAHPQAIGTPKLATPEQMAELSSEASFFRTRKKAHSSKPPPPVPLQSYAIAYAVPARQFSIAADSGAQPHTLEFAAAAYDAESHLLNGSIVHAVTAPDGKSKYYQASQPFDVPTNAAWICLAVRDAETGRIGNLEFALPLMPEPPAK